MNLATRMMWVLLLSVTSEGAIAQTRPEGAPIERIGDGWPRARITSEGSGVEVLCAGPYATHRAANVAEVDGELFVYCQGNALGKTTALFLMADEERPYFIKVPKYIDALAARCLDADKKPKLKQGREAVFICE